MLFRSAQPAPKPAVPTPAPAAKPLTAPAPVAKMETNKAPTAPAVVPKPVPPATPAAPSKPETAIALAPEPVPAKPAPAVAAPAIAPALAPTNPSHPGGILTKPASSVPITPLPPRAPLVARYRYLYPQAPAPGNRAEADRFFAQAYQFHQIGRAHV